MRYLCPWKINEWLFVGLNIRSALLDTVRVADDGMDGQERTRKRKKETGMLLEAGEISESEQRVVSYKNDIALDCSIGRRTTRRATWPRP